MSSTIPSAARVPQNVAAVAKMAARSPLAQLLHALNQPLTGLQCSMEVALAGPRTPEQYIHGLREGLELTARMRGLVEAIREVADGEEEKNKNEDRETMEWKTLLREGMDDLKPVAEVKSVSITLDCSEASCPAVVRAGRRRLVSVLFRLLDSALSLAARGSALRIETGGAADEVWMRVRWHAGGPPSAFSRPELGLLVAQAGFERAGAEWERERTENRETVTVRLPGVSASSRNS